VAAAPASYSRVRLDSAALHVGGIVHVAARHIQQGSSDVRIRPICCRPVKAKPEHVCVVLEDHLQAIKGLWRRQQQQQDNVVFV
jgi:hypothetical protein